MRHLVSAGRRPEWAMVLLGAMFLLGAPLAPAQDVGAVKARLDEAVQAGEITEEHADMMLNALLVGKATYGRAGGFPTTAFEYAKMVEPELGVPPRVDLGEAVELPLFVDGVETQVEFGGDCDNPSLLGKGCISGSVLQRHEGRTEDGEPLPDVVWVSFGRNSTFTWKGLASFIGSVQLIGYHRKTGATAMRSGRGPASIPRPSA